MPAKRKTTTKETKKKKEAKFFKEENAWTRDRNSAERVKAFSDAVFAIAITLLILQIEVPSTLADNDIVKELRNLWPTMLAYLISFLVIGRFWLNHFHLTRYLKKIDKNFIYINLLFLLTVTFLPFPSDLYGTHGDNKIALAIYTITIAFVALMSYVLWWYVYRHQEMVYSDVDKKVLKYGGLQRLMVPVIFLFCTALIFINDFFFVWFWAIYVILAVGINYFLKKYQLKELKID
ncbi:MAG: TMEM175 family protein [Patescibacteria group bacterium]|nr:DUF1211 domain-containing protein [Patescibacteria group bacterium]